MARSTRQRSSSPSTANACIVFFTLSRSDSGDVLATAEQMLLHVDAKRGGRARRRGRCSEAGGDCGGHAGLEWPVDAGRFIGDKRVEASPHAQRPICILPAPDQGRHGTHPET